MPLRSHGLSCFKMGCLPLSSSLFKKMQSVKKMLHFHCSNLETLMGTAKREDWLLYASGYLYELHPRDISCSTVTNHFLNRRASLFIKEVSLMEATGELEESGFLLHQLLASAELNLPLPCSENKLANAIVFSVLLCPILVICDFICKIK